jgi:lysozyme family protein
MGEFDRALAKVLVHEGGYVNHPSDPGGETNRGVTRRVYDDYRRSMGLPVQSVKHITNAEVTSIYRMRYWSLIKGDSLPPGVSYVVFDGAVNSGVSQSAKWLQRALGVKVDGVIGPGTLDALRAVNDHDALVAKIISRRMAFLKALKTWKTFGKGWTARVNGVLAVGQAWAAGSVGPEIQYVPNGEKRAFISDAKAPPSTAPGDAAAGGGSIGAVIAQAQEQLTPFVNIGFVAKAAAALTIAGTLIAVGGIAYRIYANRRKAQITDALDLVAA